MTLSNAQWNSSGANSSTLRAWTCTCSKEREQSVQVAIFSNRNLRVFLNLIRPLEDQRLGENWPETDKKSAATFLLLLLLLLVWLFMQSNVNQSHNFTAGWLPDRFSYTVWEVTGENSWWWMALSISLMTLCTSIDWVACEKLMNDFLCETND